MSWNPAFSSNSIHLLTASSSWMLIFCLNHPLSRTEWTISGKFLLPSFWQSVPCLPPKNSGCMGRSLAYCCCFSSSQLPSSAKDTAKLGLWLPLGVVAELGKSDSCLLSANLLTGNAYLTLVQRECLPLIPTRLPLQQQQGIQEFPKGIFKAQVFIYIIFFNF